LASNPRLRGSASTSATFLRLFKQRGRSNAQPSISQWRLHCRSIVGGMARTGSWG
jgi:hypothetical protein